MDNENIPNNDFQPTISQPPQSEVATEAPKDNKLKFYLLFGGAFLLLVAAIVGVVVALNNRGGDSDGGDEFDYYYIGTDLFDSRDVGFLGTDTDHPTKYEIFNEYEEYEDCYNTIDEWAESLYERRTGRIGSELDLEDDYEDDEEYDEEDDEEYDEEDDEEYDEEYDEEDDVEDDDSLAPGQQEEGEAEEYKKSIEERVKEIKRGFGEGEFDEEFFEDFYLVLVEHREYGGAVNSWDVEGIERNGGILNVSFEIETSGVYADGGNRIYFITVPKISGERLTSVDVNINNVSNSEPTSGRDPFVAYKPIIYLYPTKETNVSVKLKNADLITTSYPKYVDGWNVLAHPNGDLVDNETGRNLYSLYYESKNAVEFGVKNDGFVVEGKDVAGFLEEKLAVLGLSEREAEEFIVYWLPKLEANKYNYIRFATTSEINENMPLEVAPEPDTVVRVLMIFKGLDEPITVTPQTLSAPERTGFTVVEWGGTEIK